MAQPPWEKGMTVGLGPPLPTECRPCPDAIRNTLRNTSSSPHPYLGGSYIDFGMEMPTSKYDTTSSHEHAAEGNL
ncbi:hypothetical protein CY34DRAFT_17167 [Suillus luteus UH-Slu-Lm8-n1]|uniref:Uncharacterized protein n=1 Tax=Suillus luteus UH-Slu-Lm8-n1 TaxID=930992 RepID=A0A0D0ATD0_9AGAM|nr:hypothetical protein CY34DRAFT_17167 [Suillus luteus UH-Slu-Lm8-n1]